MTHTFSLFPTTYESSRDRFRGYLPAIQKMYDEYKDQGFVVLAVNSTVQDSAIEIPTFIAEYSLNFPILLDELGDVTRMYQVRSLPSSSKASSSRASKSSSSTGCVLGLLL